MLLFYWEQEPEDQGHSSNTTGRLRGQRTNRSGLIASLLWCEETQCDECLVTLYRLMSTASHCCSLRHARQRRSVLATSSMTRAAAFTHSLTSLCCSSRMS